ncbi:hypothetical protein MLD38_020093 [Melastoma candidum]|uniref:Uncharacterized protein n=2 Tax=Melastoma candidum TaxID=119954 RepID=A0ACB9QEU4_9MYRT|nr:hypothetical protein MLD38_020093 [Melastoma candidum]
MATFLRHPSIGAAPPPLARIRCSPSAALPANRVSFAAKSFVMPTRAFVRSACSDRVPSSPFWRRLGRFRASGDAEAVETDGDSVETRLEDVVDGAVATEFKGEDDDDDEVSDAEEESASAVLTSLQIYKEALAVDDRSKIVEIESFLNSIEDEKNALELKVTALSAELSIEKDRVLRISADFDNFRKRTERERSSLVANAQGEVVENFFSVLDNFERAKTQIKVESEGEEKINDSYQSIYKQFTEILSSLGVVPVETIGNPFDPLLHEAIMREETTEFEEGIILEEYRKGFKLGDRLLRPSMVKVSAGPGPAKKESDEPAQETDSDKETSEESATEN